MAKKINPKTNLKLRYKKVMQFALALSLLFCIVVFQAFKKFDHSKEAGEIKLDKIVAAEIPPTTQEKLPPPPSRPAVPIESEDENIPDNVTIDDTIIKYDVLLELLPGPVIEQEDKYIFWAYDDPPKPIGGFEAIHKNLVYPELARKANIEGTVVVEATINERGEVIETRIVAPLGNSGCNEAAVAAIKAVRWEPAKQRDKPVKVRISIPIRFRLK